MSEPQEVFRVTDEGVMLLGMECTRCGFRWFPALTFGCERCGAHGADVHTRDLDAQGTIYTFADVPAPGGRDFTIAHIILKGGPSIRGLLDTRDGRRYAPGDPVRGSVLSGDPPRLLFGAE